MPNKPPMSIEQEARERKKVGKVVPGNFAPNHICYPPFSGWNQDGQQWECPGCGAVYEWFEDEAEGGFWENVVDVEEA